jgi:hypothetical protein
MSGNETQHEQSAKGEPPMPRMEQVTRQDAVLLLEGKS